MRRKGHANWPLTLAMAIQRERQYLGVWWSEPILEHRFHETRRWRFDLAFISEKLAVEVDGGGWINGRHSRGGGIEADCEKYAEAMKLGWRVLRVTPKQVQNGMALRWIEQLMAKAEAGGAHG